MRLFTAIKWFFKILGKGDAAFAEAPAVEGSAPAEKPTFTTSRAPAVQVLAQFQQHGRLLDFLNEDLSGFSDEEVGAAARDIHRGCQEALKKNFALRRVVPEAEGASITVPEGFDPSAIDLQGNVAGAAPYKGTVIHGGWYVEEIKLPTVAEGADPNVAAPAQVEVK